MRLVPQLEPVTTAFVFAHPDDDTLVAGTIRHLVDAGAAVHCIWVTGAEHDGPLKWQRWDETKAAMAVLGLGPQQLHFMDLPFLKLLPMLDGASGRLATLLRELDARQVIAVGFEGGHVDHDAVSFMCWEAASRLGIGGRLFEFPLYNGSGPVLAYRFRVNEFPQPDETVFHVPLTPQRLRLKWDVLRAYASQWTFMVTFRVIAWMRRHGSTGEPLRPVPLDRDYTVRPHAGTLNIERWFNRYMGVSFEDFQEAVCEARRARELTAAS